MGSDLIGKVSGYISFPVFISVSFLMAVDIISLTPWAVFETKLVHPIINGLNTETGKSQFFITSSFVTSSFLLSSCSFTTNYCDRVLCTKSYITSPVRQVRLSRAWVKNLCLNVGLR